MKLPLSFGYLSFKTRNIMAHSISALKLFYIKVIRQPLKFKHIEYPRSEKIYQRLLKGIFA
jgi:hypothetical protein